MIAAIYARKSIVVGLGLLFAGCASFKNTPAQDRTWAAYEQYRTLPGTQGAQIERVDPDGAWWWWSSGGMLAVGKMNYCMNSVLSGRGVQDGGGASTGGR